MNLIIFMGKMMKISTLFVSLCLLLSSTQSLAKGGGKRRVIEPPQVVNTPTEAPAVETEAKVTKSTVERVATELYQNLISSELVQISAGENSQILANLMFELCTKSPAGKDYSFEQLQVYCLIPLDVRVCASPKLLKGKTLRESFNECDVEYKTGNIENMYEVIKATFIDKEPSLTSQKLAAVPSTRSVEQAPFIMVLYDALDVVLDGTPAHKMLEGEEWIAKQLPSAQ